MKMIRNVKAKFTNGTIVPLEPLDLEEGAEVTVSVEGAPGGASEETPAPKRGLAAIVEMVDRLRESYPPDMWDGLPTDLAKNKKHYLYGHPKEQE